MDAEAGAALAIDGYAFDVVAAGPAVEINATVEGECRPVARVAGELLSVSGEGGGLAHRVREGFGLDTELLLKDGAGAGEIVVLVAGR